MRMQDPKPRNDNKQTVTPPAQGEKSTTNTPRRDVNVVPPGKSQADMPSNIESRVVPPRE